MFPETVTHEIKLEIAIQDKRDGHVGQDLSSIPGIHRKELGAVACMPKLNCWGGRSTLLGIVG